MIEFKKLIEGLDWSEDAKANLTHFLALESQNDYFAFIESRFFISKKREIGKHPIELFIRTLSAFSEFVLENLGKEKAKIVFDKSTQLLEYHKKIQKETTSREIVNDLLSRWRQNEPLDVYIKKNSTFFDSDFPNIQDELKEYLEKNTGYESLDELFSLIQSTRELQVAVGSAQDSEYERQLENFLQSVPDIDFAHLRNQEPLEIILGALKLKFRVQMKDFRPDYKEAFLAFDYDASRMMVGINPDVFLDHNVLASFLSPFKCVRNDVREFGRLFRPINPVLFCSALSILKVTGEDYQDTIKAFVTGVGNEYLDTKLFTLDGVPSENLDEVLLLEPLFMLGLLSIGKTYLDRYQFEKSSITRLHFMWAQWLAVNPVCLLGVDHIRQWWTEAYTDCIRTNTIIHNERERLEKKLRENARLFNQSRRNKNNEESKRLIREKKTIDLMLKRILLLYEFNVSEIHANFLSSLVARKFNIHP